MVAATSKAFSASTEQISRRILAARGEIPSDIVFSNVTWLDVFTGAWHVGDVAVFDGYIVGVCESYAGLEVIDGTGLFLVPGYIDSHVHIESSMMTPNRFAESVLPRGTTTVIWDPHEIANVKGRQGIDWALAAAQSSALDIFVMVPSCVPSTSPGMALESSGAELSAKDIETYANHPRVTGLAEMMNWPGLLAADTEVLAKLRTFQHLARDGHCPGLTGRDLNAYASAGIHSCHESTRREEASEKLSKGINVLIREGSCAKDADELLPLLSERSSVGIGFCSDDRNPLDIEEAGHIDCIVNKALGRGIDAIDVFRAASFSPARMFGLSDRGAVAPGYLADVILLRQVKPGDWSGGAKALTVLKRGKRSDLLAVQAGQAASTEPLPFHGANLNLGPAPVTAESFKIPASSAKAHVCRVIGVRPRQIITDSLKIMMTETAGDVVIDLGMDVLKIAVVERHHGTGRLGTGLVQGFKIKRGAIATSINHDCHNIIVTGSSEQLMAHAVNELCRIDGGIIVVSEDGSLEALPLPIGGLMTNEAPPVVSAKLRKLKALARLIGCELEEPFLQLSFLALPVIPSLKITDQGLVDGESFRVVPVIEEPKHNV